MRIYQVIGLAAVVSALVLPSAAKIHAGQDMDGVIMHEGHVMTMERGRPIAPIEHAMVMSNGCKVMPSGLVKMKHGERHLTNGEMMMMDGYVMKGGKAKAMER
jgi:hypothetical protein